MKDELVNAVERGLRLRQEIAAEQRRAAELKRAIIVEEIRGEYLRLQLEELEE